MKKIVGIIAAVAMAASVFAADVSAKGRLAGSLFNYDGSNATALNIDNDTTADYNAALAFAASDDRAGTEFKLWFAPGLVKDKAEAMGLDGDEANALKLSTDASPLVGGKFQIWFKPIDMLKIIVGTYGNNINQERYSWYRSDSGMGSQGYSMELYPIDGLTIAMTLAPGWGNNWFEDSSVKELGLLVKYGADFGTLGFLFDADANFKDLKFGAGYANTFGPVNMFANVLGYYAYEDFSKVRIELYGDGNIDAFSWCAFVPVNIYTGGGKPEVGLFAKIGYALDPVSVYLKVEDNNLLADPFAITIIPGVTGNVGMMGWEVCAQVGINGSNITFGIPVNFTVNF